MRPEERVVLHRAPFETGRLHLADLSQEAAHFDAMALPQPLLGDHCRSHAHGGLARRTAAATTRVADAVFLPVAVIGMARAELRGDVGVIPAARVGVADQQRDRGAGGAAFVHAREDLHFIGLASGRGVAALAGGAALQVVDELLRRDLQPRRAPVDDAADGRAVRFAEGGDRQQLAEGIAAQGAAPQGTQVGLQASHKDALRCSAAAGRGNVAPATVSGARRPARRCGRCG